MTVASVEISLQWRAAVASARGEGYSYPNKFTVFFREKYFAPGIYRWRIHPLNHAEKESVYIGQAEVVAKRVQRIHSPSRKAIDPYAKLKPLFDMRVKAGDKVFLDVLDFSPFELNRILFTSDRLGEAYKRHFLESLCICEAYRDGYQVLNKFVDPVDKVVKELAKLGYPPVQPAQLRKALEELKTKESAGTP